MTYEPDKWDTLFFEKNDVAMFSCSITNLITVSHEDDYAVLTRDEAIAAARAILKHFDAEDDYASDRYRAPTGEEMAKFLAENPNYKPIPKEAYDPDAPLTSEIKYNFGEE